MLSLPSSTEFNKRIPKKKFYENLNVSALLKKVFTQQIENIYWRNKLAVSTINVEAGESVSEIEVFEIVLNSDHVDEAALKLIDKGIPYNIVFILTYNDKIQIWVSVNKGGKYFHTEWLNTGDYAVMLKGLNLDDIWENIIIQIGKIIIAEGNTLAEQILKDEERMKINKQIEQLEAQARKETNPRKKFELVQKASKLKTSV